MAQARDDSGERERDMTYKWTDADVQKLIELRTEQNHLFSGKRFASAAGWETVLQKMGLSALVSPARAAKKWENLKKTYKELRKPSTIMGRETVEANWKWFPHMDKAIGGRPSVRPPCLIASSSVAPESQVEEEEEEEEGESSSSSTPAKRPRRESLAEVLERAEKREEERERREEEREKRDEERNERLLKLLERIVDKM